MILLGIESTCDETGVSLVKDGQTILSNLVASSIDIHQKYGGVFPELAARHHLEVIIPLLDEAFLQAGVLPPELSAIAVAKGPGLIGSLLVGMQAAKGLSIAWEKPLIGVNHVEAHLYAAMMSSNTKPLFPALGIVLSGGHTLMLHIKSLGQYELIGTTVDDAIGEAFDKVATLLGLPYPGGPLLETLATEGDPTRFSFRSGHVKKNKLYFSFSGLKTSVLYAIQGKDLTPYMKRDIAASFQEVALKDVVSKTALALNTAPFQALYLGGGVCNNCRLKTLFAESFPHIPTFWPKKELTLDNGAMIAGLGYHKFLENPQGDPLDLEALPRISMV